MHQPTTQLKKTTSFLVTAYDDYESFFVLEEFVSYAQATRFASDISGVNMPCDKSVMEGGRRRYIDIRIFQQT